MTLKFYTLLTLLFIVVLGNLVYFFVTQESVTLTIFDVHFAPYPIAVWITVPFVFYYFINVILMAYSNIQAYFRLRNYERDFEKFQEHFYNAYLLKDKNIEYKTPRYKKLGALLKNSHITPRDGAVMEDDEKINKVYDAYNKIEKGQVADLKPFSLDSNNPLVIRNVTNRLRNEPSSAKKILNNSENFDDKIIKEAYAAFITTASISELLKYKKFVSIRSLLKILSRVNSDKEPLDITLQTLVDLTRHVTREINPKGFLELAMAVRTVLIPEERIQYFKVLLDKGFEANEALLYTYLDLEMISNAEELLEDFSDEDFPKYRAFLALKEKNYSCDIDTLLGN